MIRSRQVAFIIVFFSLMSPVVHYLVWEGKVSRFVVAFSPWPIVFSKRLSKKGGFENYYMSPTFDLYKNEELHKRQFTRHFYRRLPGSHRQKVIVFYALRRKRVLSDRGRVYFYRNLFCKKEYVIKAMGVKPPIDRVVISFKERVLHDIQCKD